MKNESDITDNNSQNIPLIQIIHRSKISDNEADSIQRDQVKVSVN